MILGGILTGYKVWIWTLFYSSGYLWDLDWGIGMAFELGIWGGISTGEIGWDLDWGFGVNTYRPLTTTLNHPQPQAPTTRNHQALSLR